MAMHVPNEFRVKRGPYGSTEDSGNNGAFFLPHPNKASSLVFKVIASDGGGWEHVSVSLPGRCPTWDEMCHIKGVFWDESDCVVQFHPPKSQYVNHHSFCLHLWRPVGQQIQTPPMLMV